MKKSKLQQLLSEVDELDSLEYEKLYELHESRSSWFDPAERSQPILYNHEDYPTSRVIAWNSETVLDWCFHSDNHDRCKMVSFLSLNKRFTRAMKALSTYCDSSKDQNQLLVVNVFNLAKLSKENSKRLMRYRSARKVLWRLIKTIDLRREAVVMEVYCSVGTYADIFNQDFRQKIIDDITAVKEALDIYNLPIHTNDDSCDGSEDSVVLVEKPEITAPDSLAVDEAPEGSSLSLILDLCSRLSIAPGNFGTINAKVPTEGRGVQNPLVEDLILDRTPTSAMEQSLPTPSSTISITGESLNVSNSCLTALTSTRHSTSMSEFHSLMSKFREKQDEASFIMSTIGVTVSLGPFLLADHRASLRDVMTIMRSMAVPFGSIIRNHSNLITSDVIASMTADLDDITVRRNICLRDLDEESKDPAAEALLNADVSPSRTALSEAEGLAKEPDEILTSAEFIETSSNGYEIETPAMEGASDDATKEVTAANAEAPAAAKPPSRVSSFVSFFDKKSNPVHHNPKAKVTRNKTSRLSNAREKQAELSNAPEQLETMTKEGDPPWYVPLLSVSSSGVNKMLRGLQMSTGTMNHTSRLSHPREKHVELSNPLKLHQNMVKVGDPPWYKPVVSVMRMTELQRQKAQVSSHTPKNEKNNKVCSSTNRKRALYLKMSEMFSLWSSISTTDMAHILMRVSLLLMFTASAPESRSWN